MGIFLTEKILQTRQKIRC